MGSERQVIRELEHALADLRHESFPTYAGPWQDDHDCAAEHIKRAHELMQAAKAVQATRVAPR
jgi:hypothetical protein